jgi:tetratricopeptide (TPR) repeat protein
VGCDAVRETREASLSRGPVIFGVVHFLLVFSIQENIMQSFQSSTHRALAAFALATAAAIVTAVALPAAHAADTETARVNAAASTDYNAGKAAVDGKLWRVAADHFKRATTLDPDSADAWNMLGYSSRWAGHYPEAFAAYDKALKLDPTHRGAHSYLGVAYVKTNNLGKAREQLAKLDAICGKDCDEYKLLATAIADYKPQ